MTSAFIVRPFGKQKTRVNQTPIEVDFDRVETELIDPVLSRLDIQGRTTGEIVEAGNIRDDMFELLLTRDLVVADVTIHNANVFYELGIRHALRDKRTFLIRGKGDPMPFDALTDRYFEYDLNEPGASVDRLAEAIRRTLESEASDSPVFRSVPNLKAQDAGMFITVPSGFGEEVALAKEARRVGDLLLLASEAGGFDWEVPGLRTVGRALFDINAMEAARAVWEEVREGLPDDHEANEWLGTVYQRLGERATIEGEKIDALTRSNQSLQRALKVPDVAMRCRAEIYALIGRNHKSRWIDDWKTISDGKREAALGSPFLREAYEAYDEGFHVDLNHFYPGLNAAAMLTVLTSLAENLPDEWAALSTTHKEASDELDELKAGLANLLAAVRLSLECERRRMDAEKREDIWFKISWADLHCLSLKGRPKAVASFYRDAMASARDFHRDSAAKQLLIYRDLGLMTENVEAALAVISPPGGVTATGTVPCTLVFTGHRIDSPGRPIPRFPADKEAEARGAIAQAVDAEIAAASKSGQKVVGIAGGASGGDILFHEVCRDRNVATTLYLAMPPADFIASSVSDAGPGWIARFHSLANTLPARTLGASRELPVWLRRKKDYSIWNRNNLWMLYNGLANGGRNATVIALWDGGAGDGPGGTEGMVKQAGARGARVVILDTKTIFGA
jgi:hypothetical protein